MYEGIVFFDKAKKVVKGEKKGEILDWKTREDFFITDKELVEING